MSSKGKVAIVTGGNSGIGKAIVLALAAGGRQHRHRLRRQRRGHRGARAAGRRARRPGDRRRGRREQGRRPPTPHRRRGARRSAGSTSWSTTPASRPAPSVLDTTEAQYEKVLDDQPQERVLRHPARREADDRAGRRRPDHQHHLGARGLADAGQHRRTACRRAACACSPAPPASSSARTAITVVGVGPGAVDTPINAVDDGRPGEDEDARRRDPARPDGRARGDRQRGRVPRRRRRQLPRRPRRSSPTAASCTPAPGSDRAAPRRGRRRRLRWALRDPPGSAASRSTSR